MKYQKLKGKKHFVFESKSEFEEYFLSEYGVIPKLVDWRYSKQGDWVEADDGGIAQIIKQSSIKHHKDRKNYKNHRGYVRTIVGLFFQDDKIEMDTDFDKHPNRYRFGGSTDAEYLLRRKTREFLSNPEVVFAASICSGKTLQASYEEGFGPTHDWRRRAIFLLRRERVIKMIKENVKDKLDSKFNGDVLDFIFDQLKDLIMNTDNDNTKLGALKELSEWSGEKEKTKQITRGEMHIFEPFGAKKLAQIDAEEIKVLSEADIG
jgi:hypothetical protein